MAFVQQCSCLCVSSVSQYVITGSGIVFPSVCKVDCCKGTCIRWLIPFPICLWRKRNTPVSCSVHVHVCTYIHTFICSFLNQNYSEFQHSSRENVKAWVWGTFSPCPLHSSPVNVKTNAIMHQKSYSLRSIKINSKRLSSRAVLWNRAYISQYGTV